MKTADKVMRNLHIGLAREIQAAGASDQSAQAQAGADSSPTPTPSLLDYAVKDPDGRLCVDTNVVVREIARMIGEEIADPATRTRIARRLLQEAVGCG